MSQSRSKAPKSVPCNDAADQKAMNNLIQTLNALREKSKQTPPKPKTTPKRKKKPPPQDNNSKITSWLTKEDKEIKCSKKFKPLDVTVKNPKASSSESFKRTPSFEKYGVAMMSFEKIVQYQEKSDNYKEKVQQLDEVFDDELLDMALPTDCLQEHQFTGEILDCKGLTHDDLEKAFEKYKETLCDIIKGKKYSQRHLRFRQTFAVNELRCCPSLIVFTQEQKEFLLDLMMAYFERDVVKTNYFYLVLLPELCLLIFMDVHKMNKRKANEYLDKRPLDI